jgi:putative ABC transport system substrate-binding protein
MRRREFIALICAGVAWPFAARAQEPGRTYRLGCLLPATRDVPVNKAFLDELRRRGFVEGQNLTVEWRAYGLNPDLVSQYAAELVKARVDVIVAGGVVAIRAAQQATKPIPIVVLAEEMLEVGLVTSLARPDGNTTGVSGFVPQLDAKRVEILVEAVPGLRRMAVLADANNTTVAMLDALRGAARAHNVTPLLRSSAPHYGSRRRAALADNL